MKFYLLVAFGSAVGGMLRYWLSGAVHKLTVITFPYGTLAVNVLGTFILGLVIFYFDVKELISPEVKLFLTIGFCGGLTTFSTFSFETFNLLRDSEYMLAAGNILLNLFLTLFALLLSYYLAKLLNGG